MGLDPISYIIIERHDKRFDGYRVIGKKYIQQVWENIKEAGFDISFFYWQLLTLWT